MTPVPHLMADQQEVLRTAGASDAEALLEDAVARGEALVITLRSQKAVRGGWWAHRRRLSRAKEELAEAESQLEWSDTRHLGMRGYIWGHGIVQLGGIVFVGSTISISALAKIGNDPVGAVILLALGAVVAGGVGALFTWIGWHNREEGYLNWLTWLETRQRTEGHGALPPNRRLELPGAPTQL